ncbi:N-acetylated-alpha-linked acidic dipeptidase-like protein [Liparis tanakae]|uniref:N-acetylated-alpha-linked acidic dipeptidase-like protein n=1 Tax=Liparis tanakae TaxID=230148 RepID=A0A4Z2FUS7_9TELE|nr:N-acetylated-alpha-linked acidic dipeptidase-like protein [Liparis tanakae]
METSTIHQADGDPLDINDGLMSDSNETYPHSWYMPPSGVERGSFNTHYGDMLTPYLTAKGNQSEKETSDPDNMAEGAQIDDLVEKISDAVFTRLSSSLDMKLEQIAQSVNSVCASVTAVEKRVDEAEQRISDTEDSVSQLLAELERTETRLTEAMTRLEDQQNWSRRNNIKIINLPEHTEGTNARDFFESWLPKVLNLTVKNDRLKLDRCHRGPAHLQSNSTRPGTVYIRHNNFADKQLIMKWARSAAEVTFSGNRIHFFDDFSPAVEIKRREFLEAKTPLRDLGIRYQMLYPAVLRVTDDGGVRHFRSADEAQRFAEERKKVPK